MSTLLALCADDFGLGSAIDEGILHLLRRGRLNAVSCLSGGARWAADAAALAQATATATATASHAPSIGLHFNLTDGPPQSAAMRARYSQWPGLVAMLLATHTGRLPQQALADELQAQFDAFVAAYGQAPGHIDGHQHVHHLPGVRDALLAFGAACHPRPAVRNTAPLLGPGSSFKRWVIQASGGCALARDLAQGGWRHNRALTGVHDFRLRHGYRPCMQGWLAALPASGALLFCHPARPGDAPAAGDGIAAARLQEFEYLNGDDFTDDLEAADVVLAPAW